MKGKELLDANPLAAKIITDWYYNQMLESLNTNDVPNEFKEFVKSQAVDNETVGRIIDLNPRSLFDVLDENELFIDVLHRNSEYWVSINGFSFNTYKYSKRKEADFESIKVAIKLLNDKLENNERQDSGTSDTEIPTEE